MRRAKPEPRRDADDYSALPDARESAPGESADSETALEFSDLAPPLPAFVEHLGGQVLGASEAERDIALPEQFKALSHHARTACRWRSTGMKIKDIAAIMHFAPNSVGQMLRLPLAKDYMLYLHGRLDDKAVATQEVLAALAPMAANRIAEIITHGKNEHLVAKCSFEVFNRVIGKPAERVVVENSTALTSADIARVKGLDSELKGVLDGPQ